VTSQRADTERLSAVAWDELVLPLVRRSVIEQDVHALVLLNLERRRISHEPAGVAAPYARNQHPFAVFHGHSVSPRDDPEGADTAIHFHLRWPRDETGAVSVHRPSVVFVTGATPGVGKTTLSRRLAAAAATPGRVVALFAEADIVEREEFVEVIASFRATGMVSTGELLTATRRYVQTCLVGDIDLVVQDMLLPFLPSLLAWGLNDREISIFFAALAECCDRVELTQIHVLGDPAVSIPRAVSREDDGWLAWLISKVDT